MIRIFCFENSAGGEFFNYAPDKNLYPCFNCLIKKGLDFFHFGPGRTYGTLIFNRRQFLTLSGCGLISFLSVQPRISLAQKGKEEKNSYPE
jgi:hypothetical protein